MQRRRRTERKRTRTGGGFATRVMLFFSAVIILAGIVSRFTGGDELTATVLATPSPTPLTAAFDETVETREISLPSEVWYCLQSGIFSSEAAAQEKSLAYSDRGAPGFVSPEGGKFRVLLSAYASREDAQSVKEKLAGQQAVETYIYEMVRPALHLQLTGMRGQLAADTGGGLRPPRAGRRWARTNRRLRAVENGSAGRASGVEGCLGDHFSRIIFADCRRGMKHKMTLRDIARLLDAEVLTGEDKLDTEAITACGSDLMSDVLAFVKDRTILITGLVNAHVIRTAEMLDIICVVFARGKRPGEDILEQAREIGLPVLATKLTTYTACGELYLHGLPGTKEKEAGI